MGFFKFISRWGFVGSTARWAGRWYAFLRAKNTDFTKLSDREIFRLMITERYRIVRDDRKQAFLLSQCSTVEGLVGLVIEILKVEAALHENSGDAIYTFIKAIDEE